MSVSASEMEATMEMAKTMRTAIKMLRPSAVLCSSEACIRLAVERVFWPVGTDEDFPRYCQPCAAMAKTIAEAMGIMLKSEPLPSATIEVEVKRAILLMTKGATTDGATND